MTAGKILVDMLRIVLLVSAVGFIVEGGLTISEPNRAAAREPEPAMASVAEVGALNYLIQYECLARQWMLMDTEELRWLRAVIDTIYYHPRPCVGIGT